jgi:hypothetical protein
MAWGAAAGVAVAGLSWLIIGRVIDRKIGEGGTQLLERGELRLRQEIEATLDRELPGLVQRQIRTELGRYGVTEATGRQITTVLNYADRVGLLGVRGVR